MSETWIIKDTAPVDDASYELAKTEISFTSNDEKFTGIGIVDEGITYIALTYYRSDGTVKEPANLVYEWEETQFGWGNNNGNAAYKTLIFDTAPTGELLAWLQKNATLKKYVAPYYGFKYQDIHRSDITIWEQYKQYIADGKYDEAASLIDEVDDKALIAEVFNYMTGQDGDYTKPNLKTLQENKSSTFKQDKIQVTTAPPSGLQSGQMYFQFNREFTT